MVATPARIGFVLEPYRRAISETPEVAKRHGNLARESDDPLDTWFSSVADAQLRADERQGLLSPDRRRFAATVVDLDEALVMLNASETPCVRFIDAERGIDAAMIVTDVVIDIEAQTAEIKFWG